MLPKNSKSPGNKCLVANKSPLSIWKQKSCGEKTLLDNISPLGSNHLENRIPHNSQWNKSSLENACPFGFFGNKSCKARISPYFKNRYAKHMTQRSV